MLIAGCATGVPNLATLPARHAKTARKGRPHQQVTHLSGSEVRKAIQRSPLALTWTLRLLQKSPSAPAERRLRNRSAEVAEAAETANEAHGLGERCEHTQHDSSPALLSDPNPLPRILLPSARSSF